MSFNVLVKYGRGPRPCGCIDLKRKPCVSVFFWHILFCISCLAGLQIINFLLVEAVGGSPNLRDPDDNLLEQLQDAGARLRQRGRERDAARAEVATLRRERDEALRERDAARKQLAARNDMLAQVLKEQQY